MKKLIIAFTLMLGITSVFAQTREELKAQLAAKKDSIAKLQGQANALQGKIDTYPGWKFKAFGTIGANLSGFSNWYSKGSANTSSAGNIGIVVNGIANLDREKFFWRNSANANLTWVKNDVNSQSAADDNFEGATDVFTLSSLYGRKLSDKLAISALGEYRTSIINNFNNPGFLDFGVGATWTPIQDLVVVIHPLNYNIVFGDNPIFKSTLGAKIVADYARKIGAVNFKTNLSMFQSYKSSDFSNWTWTNSFGYTFWKGIGVGFEFGLRQNKQEALNYNLGLTPQPNPVPTFNNVDNKVQSYWLLGLNYTL